MVQGVDDDDDDAPMRANVQICNQLCPEHDTHSKIPLRTETIEHSSHRDSVHYWRVHHCTRASRADEVQLAKHVSDLVTRWPCGAEECNDCAAGVLEQDVLICRARPPPVLLAVGTAKEPHAILVRIWNNEIGHRQCVLANYDASEAAVVSPLEFRHPILFIGTNRPPQSRHTLSTSAYRRLETVKNTPRVEELTFPWILVGP